MAELDRASRQTPDAPAWRDDELADPHAAVDKARRVERMFAAIADSYDLNNRLHSLGRDQAWRRAAVRLAGLQQGEVVADIACGTGDLAMAFHHTGLPRRVLGLDFTLPMLQHAMGKRRPAPDAPGAPGKKARATLSYQAGDAMRLPLADASVDVLSIAFGIRNVTDPAVALGEFFRVLRPGGRVIVLEFTEPTHPLVRLGNNFYSKWLMPRTASWIARDRSGAYRYLPRSVQTFMDKPAMVHLIGQAGFDNVVTRPLTLGIAVAYRGVKPGANSGVSRGSAGGEPGVSRGSRAESLTASHP